MVVLRSRLLVMLLVVPLVLAPGARAGRRSPTTAFGMALVPGFALHGAGHYYAGERKTAGILFLTEIFGLALMNLDHPRGDIPQQIGDRERDPLDSGDLASLGRVLFFGSWLYDMGAAGDAARRHNDRRLRDGLQLGFQPVEEGRRLSFNPRAAWNVSF